MSAFGLTVQVLRRADNSVLPAVGAPDGKTFCVCEEGSEFNVKVQITNRAALPRPPVRGAELQIACTIDSQDVGYMYGIGLCSSGDHPQATFDGFCERVSQRGGGGGRHMTHYRAFKFAHLTADADAGPQVADPEQIKAGRINIEVMWVVALADTAAPPTGLGRVGGARAAGHLPEGKKFFLAPSLATEPGQAEARVVKWSRTRKQRVGKVGTIELRYETASTLMLRGVLNKSLASHRALLRHSRDPGVLALLGDDTRDGRVKAEPGAGGGGGARVKRERDSGGGGGGGLGGGGSIYLDLTRAPDAPIRVGGRELGADEVAVCDLADSGDEGGGGGGRWEVRKKQAVEVDD